MQDQFADMIGNISIASGVVRIDFMRMKHFDAETKQAQFELSHRLAMPIEGFLRSVKLQERIKAQLIKDGVITIKPQEQKPV